MEGFKEIRQGKGSGNGGNQEICSTITLTMLLNLLILYVCFLCRKSIFEMIIFIIKTVISC